MGFCWSQKFQLSWFESQGGTLIFSYIRRLGSFFGGQNFEFQYFLGFSEKLTFFGYEHFVNIFWGHHKNGVYFGVISMHLRVKVLRSRYRLWDIFWGWYLIKISNIFWGAWNSWYFLGWMVDAGPEPTCKENMRVPPLGIQTASSIGKGIIYLHNNTSSTWVFVESWSSSGHGLSYQVKNFRS